MPLVPTTIAREAFEVVFCIPTHPFYGPITYPVPFVPMITGDVEGEWCLAHPLTLPVSIRSIGVRRVDAVRIVED